MTTAGKIKPSLALRAAASSELRPVRGKGWGLALIPFSESMSLIYCSFVLFWNQLQLTLIQPKSPSLPEPGPRTGSARSDASAAATALPPSPLPLSLLPPCCHCPCCHHGGTVPASQGLSSCPARRRSVLQLRIPTGILSLVMHCKHLGRAGSVNGASRGFLHSCGSTDCLCYPSLPPGSYRQRQSC